MTNLTAKKAKIDKMDLAGLHIAFDCLIKLPKSEIGKLSLEEMRKVAYQATGIERQESYEKVKTLIREKAKEYCCGLYFTRNIVGDLMDTIYTDSYFTVDVCGIYSYFEVFGCDAEEQEELSVIYEKHKGW